MSAPLEVELDFPSEDALRGFAEEVGERLGGGEVLALSGPLGAGKTVFAQSLARGAGVPAATPVTSPTFVLHRRYAGRIAIEHLDAYRLRSARDLEALGIGELIEGGGATVIEWADRVAEILPAHTVWIELDVTGPCSRRLRARIPDGDRPPALARLRALCVRHGACPAP
ncbi:MAG TPA: tRNA (adenosine(37)-N6)-threonylcarbamoyltransferase complex ATPase subunit type 1 TsaE [Planctomycetota bacterium]|nr:tRNA (adenosine(37)-N6)-threonylcarbamoyltransferase complex ATPase subunit type 1 TsaE [Planctomycetota bacterium]OQC21562.1 MAG: tRNA threonylcarbamoyladenosine biosynthesis protein TsaE [Planctomycetes bacterium ADurb.Bin069]NMD34617.1 tRNA (adenosine(37)-N6)-threonylcarbamoyltransferase complex ATPase subunit type 1 TsaE [Planctomycetota bacterium]HNR98572.1 tRNA (adenosine(37)-N6)-threonylcarbamoyltransferase complex ATPase subunit type 1 TsaE [Planctomycetota bacterium]HNU26117.1 tRNA 